MSWIRSGVCAVGCRSSGCIIWGVTEVVSAVSSQGHPGSWWTVLYYPGVVSFLVLSSSGYRVFVSAQQIRVARIPGMYGVMVC